MNAGLAVFGIVFAVLFAGCTGLVSEGGGPAATECASDFPCFVSAMQNNCTGAKVSVVENGVTAKLEVKGASQNGTCNVLIKMTDIQKTPDMPDSVWKVIEASKAGLPLLDMACPISAQKAQSLYQEKQILAAKEVFEKCKGSLKDIAMLVVGQNAQGQEAAVFSASVSVFPPEISSGAKAGIVAKGTGGKEPYRYDFEFGDGKSSMNALEATQQHQYENSGNAPKEYVVKITVRDVDLAQAKAEAKMKVNPAVVAAPAQLQASCTENDDSSPLLDPKKYAVKGTTIYLSANGSTNSYTDYCTNANMIYEYFCINTTAMGGHNPYCNAVVPGTQCSNGVCVPQGGQPQGNPAQAQLQPSCTESDGASGETKYGVRGTTTAVYANGSTETKTDECVNADNRMIKEYFCVDGVINSHIPYCGAYITGSPQCSNGACVNNETKCVDSDGFTNYWAWGTVTVNNGGIATNYQDYCEGPALIEYYCQGTQFAIDTTNCANYNKTCTNGKCA